MRVFTPDGRIFSLKNGNIIDGNTIKFVDYENDLKLLGKRIKQIEDKYELSYKFAVENTNTIDAKVFSEIFDLIKDKVTYIQYIN